MPALNVFIDESGDFEFSPKGSRLFVLTAVTTFGCDDLLKGYFGLKQHLALRGEGLERFHATNDSILARGAFFDFIAQHVDHRCMRVDSVIARKNRANPVIREPEVFYSMMLKFLLQWVFAHHRAHAPYQLHHHSSASHPLLQVADYCCWGEKVEGRGGPPLRQDPVGSGERVRRLCAGWNGVLLKTLTHPPIHAGWKSPGARSAGGYLCREGYHAPG